MANPPNGYDQDELTRPPGYFQVRKPMRPPAPARPPSSDVDFSLFFDPRNRAYLALAVCGLIALIAFFVPYFTVSTVTTATPTFLNIPLAQSTPATTTGADAANGFGLLWLVLLAALVVIVVASILVLDTGLLRALTPIIAAIAFVVCGLLGFVVLIVSLFRANGDIAQANHILNQHSAVQYQVILGLGPGFWLSLLAMLAIAIIGGLRLRALW
jgi:hypothetical protein